MGFSFRDVNDDLLSGYSRPNCLSHGYIQNPHNVREAILRDLEEERKRIREQLLMASNAHKLVMEAGWRIEFSLERQMAIVRSNNFPSISVSTMTRYDAGLSTMVSCGPAILEMNHIPEFSNEKFEVTFPAEAQEVFCGAKHKAETPPPEVSGVPDIPSAGAKKNLKREWNCALCKLSFPNVQMLNGHVQGREHCAAFARFKLVSEEYNHPVKIVKSNSDHELEQNADESKKKIGKELTSQATLNIDDSRKENGNLTLQMLKLTNNRDFVEVAQTGGVNAEKACTHKKETNDTSSEIAVTNHIYNLEQAKSQNNVSGSKRKAETQPLEAVGASKIPSAGAKKNPKREFRCRPCGLFQPFFSNEQINLHMQGRRHKAAERREKFATCLVSKDNNNCVKTVKASCNRNLDEVIQNSEELKKVNGEKNMSAEAATQIIDDSKKINGNLVVQMLKLANNNEKFIAPSVSQNDGFQVGKTASVEQETPMISPTKDKDMHKLEQAKGPGFLFWSKA